MSAVYDRPYARRYREHDDVIDTVEPYVDLVRWLRTLTSTCPRGFAALDLGCGTGRYFWALDSPGLIVGLDASSPMLHEATRPLHADRITARRVALVRGDLSSCAFAAEAFDIVYSVGVLAEHVAFDDAIVARVARWLRPRGRFAFTTVHPESPSVPRTMRRRLGRCVKIVPAVRTRLLSGGMYADERRVRELLDGRFVVEQLERFQSEAHLHCRCIARKAA